MIKNYTCLRNFKTFEERFKYLKMFGKVGEESFGFDRYINQQFYRSSEWKRIRSQVIARDNGCDLGIPDRPITGIIIVHHINGMSVNDISEGDSKILNPEYLICVSEMTHKAIHFSDEKLLAKAEPTERHPNDTVPWKQN